MSIDVDDEPAAVEVAQRVAQRRRALERVEGEDRLAPAGPGQPLGLLGQQRRARTRRRARRRRCVSPPTRWTAFAGGLDAVDLGEAELDPVVQLRAARADDLVRLGQAERDEQQARLVDVAVVAVDDHDLDSSPYARRRRLAVSVPPVPAPRMTMRRATSRVSRAGGQGSSGIRPGGGAGLPHDDYLCMYC